MTLQPRLSPCAPLAYGTLTGGALPGGTLPHHRLDLGARPPAPEPITSFTGPFAFLANAYPSPFLFEAWGATWTAPTVEHAFQALKAGTGAQFQDILASPSADTAWQAGQHLVLRGTSSDWSDWSDWEDVKIEIMLDLVRRKFGASLGLTRRLEETGAALLIHENAWHDPGWGACRCPGCEGAERTCWGRC